MNRVLRILLTALIAFSTCGVAAGQHKNFILVIDPGHGGDDPGATHGHYHEAAINLDVSLALGALIRREMPDVDVLFTRTDDRKVGLAARGEFANRAGADLFLSIHTNASKSASAAGAETYVMGTDRNEENLAVAKRENEVIRYEEDYATTYAGFDPSSAEMSIIFGMLQYANFESSLRFARLVQKHYSASSTLRDRGAKQDIFAVLWRPTMPRVLTEMGFISNSSDRAYLFSEKGRNAIVRALFEAFREYKRDFDAATAAAAALSATAKPTDPPPPRVTKHAVDPAQPARATVPVASTGTKTDEAKTTGSAAPLTFVDVVPTGRPAAKVVAETPAEPLFYVQLAATRTRVSTGDGTWGEWRGRVVETFAGGWYRYSLGPFTRAEADETLHTVRRGRFREAFTVQAPETKK